MATATEKNTKYIIRKSNDGSNKVVVADTTSKNSATFINDTLKVNIGNNEILYPDGINANSITLKDKNASVYYEDGKPHVIINNKPCDINSPEAKKILAEAEKIRQQADAFALELTKVPSLKNHRWTKNYVAQTQNKFAKRVDARQASKQAKQRVEGRRGATEVDDPNLVVANGGVPSYSKSYSKPKSNSRVTSENIDELANEAVTNTKNITEEDVEARFDEKYGEGAYQAVKKAKTAEIAAKRMKAQSRR